MFSGLPTAFYPIHFSSDTPPPASSHLQTSPIFSDLLLISFFSSQISDIDWYFASKASHECSIELSWILCVLEAHIVLDDVERVDSLLELFFHERQRLEPN